jgi:imidazolonepropionase-like amidohydrolase
VKAAHAMGRKVAAHAHGTDGINAALRAGIDSIEHGSFQDDESIRLFKETKAWYIPTLLAGATTIENSKKPGYYLPIVAKKAQEVGPIMVQSFRKAHAAGVRIAFGTDTGVSPHGQNAREFALMVGGGMSPNEAITCATIHAAQCLGIEKDVGTLEAGKVADVIAVDADPLKDVTELERVKFVMKGGMIVKGGK